MIYVMSDIHGNEKRFNDILKQIKFSNEDTLYILGDVVDRGEAGIKILRRIMKAPNMKMLLGNHEYMMLNALYYIEETAPALFSNMRLWYSNGGQITHNQFKHYTKAVRQEILEFIGALPLNIEIEVNGNQYILVHAGLIDNYRHTNDKYRNSTEYAVWTRDADTIEIPQGKTLIFGHTPTIHFWYENPMQIWKDKDRIGIDCGCSYDWEGQLLCLRLDDMKEFYSAI